MLQGHPTKGGTGISIFGDHRDLTSLYETVHHIATALDENDIRLKGQHQLLMNFAYEIRKAYSGNRLKDKVKNDEDNPQLHYLGFKLTWVDILVFISVLRHNVGYIQSDKLQQANLYMLEYILEKALFNYDPEGANSIQNYIGQRINVTNQYSFIIYQALHIKFVLEKQGKKRFRNIPQLIEAHFSEWQKEYKDLIKSFEISAKEKNCEITDLGFSDFPDIKW